MKQVATELEESGSGAFRYLLPEVVLFQLRDPLLGTDGKSILRLNYSLVNRLKTLNRRMNNGKIFQHYLQEAVCFKLLNLFVIL